MSRVKMSSDLSKAISVNRKKYKSKSKPSVFTSKTSIAIFASISVLCISYGTLYKMVFEKSAAKIDPYLSPISSRVASIQPESHENLKSKLKETEKSEQHSEKTTSSTTENSSHDIAQFTPEMVSLSQFISGRYAIAKEASRFIVFEAYRSAKKHEVDPILVLAIMAKESSFNPISGSSQGALGLMQAMPKAHPEKIEAIENKSGNILNISDNIEVGVLILKEYLKKSNGNVAIALQRYNGNLNDPSKYYTKRVMDIHNVMRKVSGKTEIKTPAKEI